MLKNPIVPIPDHKKPPLKQCVNFIADRRLDGFTDRAIARDVLAEFGHYPKGMTFGKIQPYVEEELAKRKIPREQIDHSLKLYRPIRELLSVLRLKIRSVERIHQLLGLPHPDRMLGIEGEPQMQTHLTFEEVATEADRLTGELRTLIDQGASCSQAAKD